MVVLPVRRDELVAGLEAGLGDIAAANLTVTPERQKVADFSIPFGSGVRELVVTEPDDAGLSRLEDLSGREVFVRPSSSYWASLVELNARFAKRGLPPVELVAAEEYLEDEDLLEMVNAGLIPATVVGSHVVSFWKDIFPNLVVRDALAVREEGSIAWAIRKGSPKLKRMVDEFVRANRKGTLTTNVLLKRSLKSNPWVRNPLSTEDRERFEQTLALFEKYGQE